MSHVRLWLKKDYTLIDGDCLPNPEKDEASGRPYLKIKVDPINPTNFMPLFDETGVEFVTYEDRNVCVGLRPEGVYTYKGAVLLVATHYDSTLLQNYFVRSPDVKTLLEIYDEVRSGKLRPEKNWSKTEEELSSRKTVESPAE
jgi:hypothetical protein